MAREFSFSGCHSSDNNDRIGPMFCRMWADNSPARSHCSRTWARSFGRSVWLVADNGYERLSGGLPEVYGIEWGCKVAASWWYQLVPTWWQQLAVADSRSRLQWRHVIGGFGTVALGRCIVWLRFASNAERSVITCTSVCVLCAI